jgi:predicted XRE-type DNA-binding protein
MCLLYSYRIDDKSLETLIRTRHGSAIVEFLSDHQLYTKQLSEVFGVPAPEINITQQEPGSASSNNPVPG